MNRLEIYLNNFKDYIILRNKSIILIIRFYEYLFLI